MQPALTAAEARALDAAIMGELGLPGVAMMEAAGRGVAAAVEQARATRPGPVAVVCGGGGNGGDGFVVARVLRDAGVDVVAYRAVATERIAGDARIHHDVLVRGAGVIVDVVESAQLPALIAGLTRAAIVVDAVLGTGVTRPVTGHLAAVIDAINAGPGYRIAIDVPSGLDADTGHAHGACVRADLTVTMAAPKLGLVVAPGCAAAGAVVAVDIGAAPSVLAALAPRAAVVEAADVARWLAPTDALAHKHRRGHVVVIGGSPGKRGAARLAALGALRGGAGLVTIAGAGADAEVAPDPIMTAAIAASSDVAALAAGAEAIAIGPGMPATAEGAAWLAAALDAGVPTVIDATGLRLLASAPTLTRAARAPIVLTPHPGEAAQLLGTTTAAIEADRPRAARALAATFGCVCVLKGPRTLVCDGADPSGRLFINPTGGPALATAGTGDVLAGVIAALLARGHAPSVAASLGAYLHGAAGDALARRLGTGVIASELPEAIAVIAATLGSR